MAGIGWSAVVRSRSREAPGLDREGIDGTQVTGYYDERCSKVSRTN